MKVIKRPGSTTVCLEIPFHVIKSGKELENACEGYTSKELDVIQKGVNPKTFLPFVYFSLTKSNYNTSSLSCQPFYRTYYLSDIEYFNDSKRVKKKFLKKIQRIMNLQ